MLWTFVIPFEITSILFFVALLGIAFASYKYKKRRLKILFIGIASSLILFIPTCAVIEKIVHTSQFGRYEYSNASEVKNDKVRLPNQAIDIILITGRSGHLVKFICSRDDVLLWIESLRIDGKPFLYEKAPEKGHEFPSWVKEKIKEQFKYSGYVERICGPRQSDSGGFNVYLTEEGVCFLDENYW